MSENTIVFYLLHCESAWRRSEGSGSEFQIVAVNHRNATPYFTSFCLAIVINEQIVFESTKEDDNSRRDTIVRKIYPKFFNTLDIFSTLGDPGSSRISEPFLLVTDRDGGIILQVNIPSGSTTTLPLGDVGKPLALDYDPLTDYVYWSDDRNDKIHRARRDGSGRETILDINYVVGLALDHAGGDIYWTDYDENTISVAKMNGSSTRTLAVSRPYDLVLDPKNGLMYWADRGNDRIDRAAMDGSNPTTIITGLSSTRAVTIDYREDRLYYSDGTRMYSSDLLGNDIQQLLYESGKTVRGIAVDENYVYWSSS
ncbi:PREDICTED: low-density lipoprotein receptor-related protein 6-like, partial [Branchiostoma belcheri]|uniref:Low-density lipoprotein receptor-related protein 6-like n=1 Tax=Branchiostoma belcheri TaxID=7741 RepID=A0A6P4ZJ35_BRABE